jgi:hypothetical protein
MQRSPAHRTSMSRGLLATGARRLPARSLADEPASPCR